MLQRRSDPATDLNAAKGFMDRDFATADGFYPAARITVAAVADRTATAPGSVEKTGSLDAATGTIGYGLLVARLRNRGRATGLLLGSRPPKSGVIDLNSRFLNRSRPQAVLRRVYSIGKKNARKQQQVGHTQQSKHSAWRYHNVASGNAYVVAADAVPQQSDIDSPFSIGTS